MNRMTLSKRLYGVAAVVAVVLVTCAAVSWRLGSLASEALAAEEANTRAAIALGEAESAVWGLRWGVANDLASSDAKARAKVVEDSPGLRTKFEEAWKSVETSGSSAEERARYEALRSKFAEYAQGRLEFFNLMEAGKASTG